MRARFGRFLVLLVGVFGLVVPSAAGHPRDVSRVSGSTVSSPSPGTVLLGVSCVSASACSVVGHSPTSGGGESAFAAGWDGSVLSVQSPPDPSGAVQSVLSGVSCTEATACTAVGSYTDSTGAPRSLAERWGGTSWTIQTTPNPAGAPQSVLSGVSCSAKRACIAVGYEVTSAGAEVPLAERWDGTSWTIQTTPEPAGAGKSVLSGVSCTVAAACTAVGYFYVGKTQATLAERFDGKGWAIQPTPNPAGTTHSVLKGVSCSASTVCTAVGYYVNSTGVQATLAETWDGTGWTIQNTPSTGPGTNVLSGVSCRAAAACTAVGYDDIGSTPVTLAERWDGTSWTVQSTPNLAGVQRSVLGGVSCTAVTSCTAVGSYTGTDGNAGTLTAQWDGTAWTVQLAPGIPTWVTQPSPNPTTPHGALKAVACTSATSCTAVGAGETSSGSPETLAEGWNGTAWSIEPTPAPSGTNPSLISVSCTTPTACIAVGDDTASSGLTAMFVDGWNGATWTLQSIPAPADAQETYLTGVSCSSATACTAVGDYFNGSSVRVPLVERWDGSSWTVQAAPAPAAATSTVLSGVSCPSATACTAVGSYTDSAGDQLTLAEGWDGTTWTVQATGEPAGAQSSSLQAVSCTTSPSVACSAVGEYSASGGSKTGFAEQWNGTGWSIESVPGPPGGIGALSAVSCSAPGACTLVGYGYDSSGHQVTVADRWDGTSWTLEATRNGQAAALNGVACMPPSTCTAVGQDYNRGGEEVTLGEAWNGSSWSLEATANTAVTVFSSLNGVSCPATNMCVAVGSSGVGALVEQWDGTRWRIVATPQSRYSAFTSVSCTSTTACTAVGFGPTGASSAERWDGTEWTVQQVPEPLAGGTLQSVSCPSATMCVAVGTTGGGSFAELWDGTSWTIDTIPGGPGLLSVSCASTTMCEAVGATGPGLGNSSPEAAGWDGSSWTAQTVSGPGNAFLGGVSCTSDGACTAVGSYYYCENRVECSTSPWVAQLTGAGRPVTTDGTTYLQAVSCVSASACVAVGTDYPQYRDGLQSVSCTAPTTCTAVGSANGLTLIERYANVPASDHQAARRDAAPGPRAAASVPVHQGTS